MVLRQLSGSDASGIEAARTESAGGAAGSGATAGSATVVDADDAERPLSVCVLSYRSDPYSGGQGVYVKYLTRALARRGHAVTVVSGKPYPDLDPAVDLVKLPGENVVDQVQRLRAFELSYLGDPTKLFEWASAITGGFPDPYAFGRRAVDYLADEGAAYDVVHDNQSLCYGLLDVELPTVATIHHPITADREIALAHAEGAVDRLLTRRWFRFLRMQRRVASELPRLISVSRATKERTVADFGADPEAVSVIHNGIDTDLFRPLPEVEERPKRVMTTVSADVPLKGARYLLDAFATLRDAHPDAELVVVGEFDEGGSADALVGDLGIRDAVRTHSEISYERMVELYASSAVAAVPSLYEGFGLPAAEAMACGVPPVATTGGALPEVVGDAGRLVPPGDPDALAAALDGLLRDPAARDRLGERARQRATGTFDWDATARETVAVYRQAIDAHR